MSFGNEWVSLLSVQTLSFRLSPRRSIDRQGKSSAEKRNIGFLYLCRKISLQQFLFCKYDRLRPLHCCLREFIGPSRCYRAVRLFQIPRLHVILSQTERASTILHSSYLMAFYSGFSLELLTNLPSRPIVENVFLVAICL